MIVGITGTGVAFLRLVDALGRYARANPTEVVWVQSGPSPIPDGAIGSTLVSREELLKRLRKCDVVVCHAGSGTLADVLSLGHVPVVVPRLKQLNEHVNDHQLEIADALERQGRIIVLNDVRRLPDAIEQARTRTVTEHNRSAANALLDALAIDSRELRVGGSTKSRRRWRALRFLTAWVPVRSFGDYGGIQDD